MAEYIRREAVLKSLEYTTVWEAEAENVIALTLRAAREKVEKLPALQEKDLFPAWRNPETDPPKVETEVLILYRNDIDGYGITTAHYEDGSIFLQDSEWYWEDLPDWGTYDEERDDYKIPKGWWEYRHFNELHARQPEMERLYLDGKILPGELQALVMVSNCLEREFIHRQLATGRPLHLNI